MVSKSPSRSHGEGSIYRSDDTQSGSGVTVERWIASVDLGVDPNGKRLRKRITGPTRKAVADTLREFQRQQDAGVDVRKKSITVGDLANEWLTHLEQNEGTKEESTILRLRPRIERHVIAAGRIGGCQLDVLEAEIAEARKTRARAEAEHRAAEHVIETHVRPLRRRKHEHEIQAAQRELQRQPEVIRRADATIAAAESKLTDLAQRTSEAQEFLRRRPELESRVTDIDERLAHDQGVRSRIARLEQPAAIIDTLGPRPRGAKKAQARDQAAGHVHQHQAAFDIRDGIGDWPGRYDRSAYGVSYEALDEAIWNLRPHRPTMEVARPEVGLSGIEM